MSLWRYIQGFRKGKEAHRLEREAMEDPFLADAMDGYNQGKEDQSEEVKELQKKIRNRTKRKGVIALFKHIKNQNHSRNNIIQSWAVAASILILISVGGYYLLFQKNSKIDYIVQQIEEIKDIPTLPAEQSDNTDNLEETTVDTKEELRFSPPVQDIQEESPVIREERKKVQTPTPPVIVDEPLAMVADAIHEDMAEIEERIDVQKEIINLAENSTSSALAKSAVNAKVKGKIIDESGEPLIGASVIIDGTNKGTAADIDGYFEIETNNKEKIKVEYIGYESITLPVDTSQTMLIAMHESQNVLHETVVTAYGSSKKQASKKIETTQTPKPVIGKKAYKDYLKKELLRPTGDECSKVKGKVSLLFYIDIHGRPYGIIVEKSLCPSLDEEAIRLIKEGPDWTIGDKEVKMEIQF